MSAFTWALLTAFIWGIVPLLEKLGLTGSQPTVGLFARSVGIIIGVIVFGALWSPWKALSELSVRSFALLALGGFLASFVGQLAFYRALKVGGLSQVTLVAGSYPLVAAALGWFFLREPLTPMRVVGALLIGCGLMLLRQ
ncbi:MAG: EamA family transporter [Candidatus Omnitrophica bacterium]|nr:EamA family transporter [Candidatus Omnitrophota bacterium]